MRDRLLLLVALTALFNCSFFEPGPKPIDRGPIMTLGTDPTITFHRVVSDAGVSSK